MSKINKKVKLHQKTNWKSLSNEDLEKEYNPSSIIGGNYQPYISVKYRLHNLNLRSTIKTILRYFSSFNYWENEKQFLNLVGYKVLKES